MKKAISSLEEAYIRKALSVTGGNRTQAAKVLEISLRSLIYKIKDYGIE
jgi:two-component system response regulator AtoC